MKSRREFLSALSSAGLIPTLTRGTAFGADEVLVEELRSDPDAPAEYLRVSPVSLEGLLNVRGSGDIKRGAEIAGRMMAITEGYITANVSRDNTPGQVRQFLELFDLDGLDNGYGGWQKVPYCAVGICFAACRAYCEIPTVKRYKSENPAPIFKQVLPDINRQYFKPSPSVRLIMENAKDRGAWVEAKFFSQAKPGWLVIFSWDRAKRPNHIGLLKGALDGELVTYEYNTSSGDVGSQRNGGCVAKRIRSISSVLGFVRTYI